MARLDYEFKEWLINALVTISKQLNNVQRKLDALLTANSSVSKEQLRELTAETNVLRGKSNKLTAAIEKQQQTKTTKRKDKTNMPPADLSDDIQTIKDTEGVIDSATVFINGSAARLQAAVDAALENGATAAQLQPLTDEIAAQKAKAGDLAAAIAANP